MGKLVVGGGTVVGEIMYVFSRWARGDQFNLILCEEKERGRGDVRYKHIFGARGDLLVRVKWQIGDNS